MLLGQELAQNRRQSLGVACTIACPSCAPGQWKRRDAAPTQRTSLQVLLGEERKQTGKGEDEQKVKQYHGSNFASQPRSHQAASSAVSPKHSSVPCCGCPSPWLPATGAHWEKPDCGAEGKCSCSPHPGRLACCCALLCFPWPSLLLEETTFSSNQLSKIVIMVIIMPQSKQVNYSRSKTSCMKYW